MAILPVLLALLLGLPSGPGQDCRDLHVLVDVQGVDAVPRPADWPLDIRVLASDGSVLTSGRTGKDGTADLRVCWPKTKQPSRVEATWGDKSAVQGEIRGYDGRQHGICFLICPIHRSDCE